jgi:hypothetical protein
VSVLPSERRVVWRVLHIWWPLALGGLVTWLSRAWLLRWVAAPLIRYAEDGSCGRVAWVGATSGSVFPSFAYLTTSGALLAALPLLARLVPGTWFPAPSDRRPGVSFVLVSYLSSALGIYIARRFLWPRVVRDMFRDRDWCGETWVLDHVSVLNTYVASACASVIGVVVCFQLSLVAFAWWLSRRSPPSRGLRQTPPWP